MKRLFDVNGNAISDPPGYHSCLAGINNMIEALEIENADRSDMEATLSRLFSEARFHLLFLPNRQQVTPQNH